MADQPISRQLLQQRVRNRIMDYLQLAASADQQRDYERRVPIAQLPSEMINQWEDWVRDDDLNWYAAPVFSQDESEAILTFHDVWSAVADETPNPMPHTIDLLIGTPVWNRLMIAAQAALAVFEKRGRFDEQVERFDG
jgi:hypothetical protein